VYDNPFAGVAWHAVGGVAHGTFYAPLKRVRNWAWESAWLVQGVAAWVISPWLVAQLCGSHPWATLSQSPAPILLRTFLFGMVWGAGSLTFGLSVRYLGMSLGMAVALGYTVSLGTLVPPALKGQMTELLQTPGGRLVLLGVVVCLLGIACCGWAGIRRDRTQTSQLSSAVRPKLVFGFLIATFSGVMSSGFAFGIQSARPIAKIALANGAPGIFQNSPSFIVVMAGGFVVNGLWCLFLSLRNGSIGDFLGRRSVKQKDWGGAADSNPNIGRALGPNYGWASLAGVTWYLGFMFYGIGTTFMGRYDFTSWSIHLAFVIVFSTLCGIASGEWRGATPLTRWLVAAAIVILVSSTLVIAIGGRVASQAAGL
jgi:L-rhamnose-H+ transport protein